MISFSAEFRTKDQTDGTVEMEPRDVFGILFMIDPDNGCKTVLEVVVGLRPAVNLHFQKTTLEEAMSWL